MQFILDYMYRGEVSIYQDQLDVFLSMAQTMNVAGLIGNQEQSDDDGLTPIKTTKSGTLSEKPLFPKPKQVFNIKTPLPETPQQNVEETLNELQLSTALSKTSETFPLADMSEIDSKLEELTDRINGVWTCKSCGKTAKRKLHLHWHIESHFGDLSLPCGHCDRTFRSKRSFEQHMKNL